MNDRIERKLPMNATKTAHTPGATRAAQAIEDAGYRITADKDSPQYPTSFSDIAEIIDRETKAPQMLEALESILAGEFGSNWHERDAKHFGVHGTYWEKAMAAIRAAKGEL